MSAPAIAAPKVEITPAALKFIRRMVMFSSAGPTGGFRLNVAPGGCSGYTTTFDVEAAAGDSDAVIEEGGIRIFVNPASAAVLEGTILDFVDAPMDSGLKVTNPNAGPCGCSSMGAATAAPGVASIALSSIVRKR